MPISNRQSESLLKSLIRFFYRQFCGFRIVFNRYRPSSNKILLHYGGSFSGSVGGPLVKIQRLSKYFPDHYFNFNLLYLLSNSPYLPHWSFSFAKQRNIPIIYNQNGVFYKAWYSGDWEFKNQLMSCAYFHADYIFYQSEFCRKSAHHFLGANSTPSEILYNAIDTDLFAPSTHPKDTESPYTFLVTGKFSCHMFYRLEHTIIAFKHALKEGLDCRLIIAGWLEKSLQDKLISFIDSNSLTNHVVVYGTYTQSEAPLLYQQADAYIMLKHNDPCPNTVLEALSCALPVVYSNTGGVPELVGPDCGVPLPCSSDWDVISVPSIQSISDGMIKVYSNHHFFSSNARSIALQRFTINHWIDRHRQVFRDLLHL